MSKNAPRFPLNRAGKTRRPDMAASAAGSALEATRVKALAWVERGSPDAEIVYDDQAPELTAEQLAEFQALTAAKTIENRLRDPFRRAKGGQG